VQSIDLIRSNLRRSEEVTLARIEEMRDHSFVAPTPRGGGHTLWTLGHLAYIERLVIRKYMLGEPNPLEHWRDQFDGDEVSADASIFPPFDEVLGECRLARSATLDCLEASREEDLDQSSRDAPEVARQLFGTRRSCFQFVSDHWLMHRGQLADARRAAGLARAWY
jgi:hypothetical protein